MVLQPASSSLKSHSSEQKCPKGQSLAHAAKRGCHGFLLFHKASIFERRYQWHSHGGFWECTQPHYKQIYANGQDTLLRKVLDFGNNILLFSASYILNVFLENDMAKYFSMGCVSISLYPKKKTHGSCVLAETILSIDNNIIVVD